MPAFTSTDPMSTVPSFSLPAPLYLFIYEDMSMVQKSSFTKADLAEVGEGLLDILVCDGGRYYQYDEHGTLHLITLGTH